jgi:DNA-directed RNA polymerase specialized sigma24 family protein
MWRRRLSNEDAQDIVQEAFLLAIKKLRHDGNVNAWLKAVVDRLAAGRSRTDRRRAGLAAKWGLGIEYLKEPEMILHRDGDEVLR